ncbi:MAG: response regulator transcription factor [Candidatus Gastranaerophilales bacterium]|nr:response regulator transcription factor [Candidatus Gastranaerophilales bacterium]
MTTILAIDDNEAILELIKINLELMGFRCLISPEPVRGFAILKQENPDLLILDVMMPEIDGYSLAAKIRQNKNTKDIPIIMLTALGELDDKLKGFNSGVDDYLTKPFEIEELKARVTALLNRSQKGLDSLRVKEIYTVGDITVIPESYTVRILDKETKLTPIEFEIFNVLLQNHSNMVSSKTLLKEVWGYGDDDDPDTIRVHIRHLRTKIDKISTHKNKYIETIYGGGYRLVPNGINLK